MLTSDGSFPAFVVDPRVAGSLGVHGDAMADCELGLLAVDHAEDRSLLGFGVPVVGVEVGDAIAADEDRRLAVGGGHGDLGLEDPGAVLELIGLRLIVDEEERDDLQIRRLGAAGRRLRSSRHRTWCPG